MSSGLLKSAERGMAVSGSADMKADALRVPLHPVCRPRLSHELAVTPGVRAEEASEMLSGFFEGRRCQE